MRRAATVVIAAVLLACSGAPAGPDAAPDAATDAARDAATDTASDADDAADQGATRSCRTDMDCDDGFFCDGVEQCGPGGLCVSSRRPACDDRVGCTNDRCDEAADRCYFEPIPGSCDGGACIPGEGCIAAGDGG